MDDRRPMMSHYPAIPGGQAEPWAPHPYGGPPPQSSTGGGFEPRAIIRMARRHIWLVIIFVVLGVIAGFVSVVLATPVYNARVLLEMQAASNDEGRGRASYEADTSQVGIQTQLILLRSGPFMRRVMERMQLDTAPPVPEQNDVFTMLRRRIRRSTADPVISGRVALGLAANTFVAQPVNGTRLIELRCEAPNPEIASSFLNAVATEYVDETNRSRMLSVRRSTEWLLSQIEETKTNMRAAEDKLQVFVRGSGNLFAAQEATVDDTKLRRLQMDMAQVQAERIAKQSRWEAVKRASPEALPDFLKDGPLLGYSTQLAELRNQRAVLLATLTPNHQKVQRLQVQIDEVKKLFDKELAGAVNRVRNEYEISASHEKMLGSAQAEQAGRVTSQADRASEYNTLKREVELLRQQYASLLMQSNQANLLMSAPAIPIRLVEPSTPAQAPSKPKPATNITFGVMAGGALAVGIAFVREKLAARVSSPARVRGLTGLPQLGVIPSAHLPRPQALGSGFRRLLNRGDSEPPRGLLLGNTASPAAVISEWDKQGSIIAESFRTTLASIVRSSTRAPRVITITSAGPGEGKTTITSHLGVALSETGKKILLVDADFRAPRLHKMFALQNTTGLTTILQETRPTEQYSFAELYTPTNLRNLYIMQNGPRIAGVSKALYSERLAELLRRARVDFDTIIVDVPPVIQFVDARLMARMTDGVVLVLRAGVTNETDALEAYRRLREDDVPILGTILNDWMPSAAVARSYYYYAYDQERG